MLNQITIHQIGKIIQEVVRIAKRPNVNICDANNPVP